jgi:hypothetical protein
VLQVSRVYDKGLVMGGSEENACSLVSVLGFRISLGFRVLSGNTVCTAIISHPDNPMSFQRCAGSVWSCVMSSSALGFRI